MNPGIFRMIHDNNYQHAVNVKCHAISESQYSEKPTYSSRHTVVST